MITHRHARALAAFLLILLTTRVAPGQESWEQLKARLDSLEQQVNRLDGENRQLRQAVAAPSYAPLQPVLPALAEEPAPDAKPATDAKSAADGKGNPNEKSWEVGSNLKMEGNWSNGLRFASPDRAFTLMVGGVIQFDMGFYDSAEDVVESIGVFNNLVDPTRTLQDGMSFRRARLRMSGTAYEQIEYFGQYEFAHSLDNRQRTLGIPNPAGVANPVSPNFDPSDTVGFNEVYVGLVKLPLVGNIRVGRHRESLNFVTATADNNQIWLERGLMFEAFNGNYNFSQGVTVSNTYFDGRAYSLFGFFGQNNGNNRQFASVGDGNYAYDGRLCWLPLYSEEDQLWVHLGIDYSYRNLYQNAVRYRARPSIRVGSAFQVPSLVDSGTILSRDGQQICNLEFAAAWGPWTFAAEGTGSWVTNAFTGGLPDDDGKLPEGAKARGTYWAEGAYVELWRFLTPDHRPYIKERPGYGRVLPSRNAFLLKGDDGRCVWDIGAWEVGARFEYLDLTNHDINGGVARGVTGAINWYFSSNFRLQANYTWMRRNFAPIDDEGRVPGDLTAFGIRFNCDF